MDSAREKLKRANAHLGALGRILQRFADTEPYRIGFKVIREGETRYVVGYVGGWEPLPTSIPLMVGDICNNLQSALEHLLRQCWLDINPTFDGTVFFPVHRSPALFEANSPSNIGGLPIGQRTLIEEAQPYARGNDLLPILGEINQIDKHRLISVATATARMEQVSLIGYQTVPEYNSIHFTVRPDILIENGTELERFSLDNLETTGNGHAAESLRFNFLFTEPEAVAGHGLITTLLEIRDEVRWVIDQFDTLRTE